MNYQTKIICKKKEPEHDMHWLGSGPLHVEHDEWQGEQVCDVSER